MAIGEREEPEKDMDFKYRPKSARRTSRKWVKTKQNRKHRRLVNADPEYSYKKSYYGWEW